MICTRSHSFVGPSIALDPQSNSFIGSSLSVSKKKGNVLDKGYGYGFSDDAEESESSDGRSNDGGRIGPQDFELLRIVGQGAFGKVFQVQHHQTHAIYAMKVMKKEVIMEKNQGDYMIAERDILTKIVHPFIVQLRYSFQVSLFL